MKKVGCVGIVIVCILLVVIIGTVVLFNFVFPPNSVVETNIGNIEIGFKTDKQVVEILENKLNDYTYTLKLSDGNTKEYSINDIKSNIDSDSLYNKVKELKKFKFIFGKNAQKVELLDIVKFDTTKITDIFNSISVSEENQIESKDAYISYSEEKKSFEIVPEVYGNILVDNPSDLIMNSLIAYNQVIDLVELGCYTAPFILGDNEILLSNLENYNSYKDVKITYTFGDTNEILDFSKFYSWLVPNYLEDGLTLNVEKPFIFSDEGVNGFIAELNKKYTTIGIPRDFTTSTGETITITKGDYGWILDKKKMAESIKNLLSTKTSETLEGIFSQKGALYGTKDFSNSYVEVSIDNQKVWMYINGECILETPVVTGNVGKNMGTRKGIFSLTYKTKNAVLRGADYETPVSFWMPFDGGIGLHDATWRGSFGGSIYKWNGSHGCVNMPYNAAKKVYENIDKTMPIIVW